ncbi:CHASE domain-containing protein [Rheinheimera sp.]|uniref:CHASE domain-containing protein n=1 Tax=Rheinheimera sp. TaxID=1869214 RepID=UPI002FDD0B25
MIQRTLLPPQLAPELKGRRLWLSRHNASSWLVMALILPFFLYYWFSYSQQITNEQQEIFQQHADALELNLKQRLQHFEFLLGSGMAFVTSSEQITQAEWQRFVTGLDLDKHYSGIQAFGLVNYRAGKDIAALEQQIRADGVSDFTVHPAGERPFYAVVTHIQPQNNKNSAVLGYDMLTNPLRQRTAMRAASLGGIAITPRILLAQDGSNAVDPGLVLVQPVYKAGAELLSAEQKINALQGFVYAAFRVNDMMTRLWHSAQTELDFSWYSSAQQAPSDLLFQRQSGQLDGPAFVMHKELEWYGQPFWLQISSNDNFVNNYLPVANYWLLFFLLLMMLLLFGLLSRVNLRRYHAELLQQELQQQLHAQYQQLIANEQRQALALKASQLAWFEFDLSTGDAFYSDNWWKLFGFAGPQQHPTEQTMLDLLLPSERDIFRHDIQRILASGPEQFSQRYQFMHRQGQILSVLMQCQLLRDADGSALRLSGALLDQTHQVSQSEQQQQLMRLCQFEIAAAVASCQLLLQKDAAVAGYQLAHLHWLSQQFCQLISGAEPVQAVPVRLDFMLLMPKLLQALGPVAIQQQLHLVWRQSQSPYGLAGHEGVWWQLCSDLLLLAMSLANSNSSIEVGMEFYPGIISWQAELEVDAEQTANFLATQTNIAMLDGPSTESNNRYCALLAAKHWASVLGAELNIKHEQQKLWFYLTVRQS